MIDCCEPFKQVFSSRLIVETVDEAICFVQGSTVTDPLRVDQTPLGHSWLVLTQMHATQEPTEAKAKGRGSMLGRERCSFLGGSSGS